ncbi:MAG: YtxH domain-containing protein [Ignavibacteriales bacterium]|nr:YtxH domain-containing protein [Ignavibacteriales bacterium]
MADEKNSTAKGILIGLLIGSVVGAITALLYAPKSGKELRSDIKRKASDIADGASEYIKSTKNRTQEFINTGRSRSDQVVSDVREKAEHLMGDADKMLSEIRERAGTESGKIKAAFKAGVNAYRNEKDRDV